MKKTVFLNLAILSCTVLLAGCFTPRYTTVCEKLPSEFKADSMTLETASGIVKDAIEGVPAGHRPDHPGDRTLGKYATSVRLRKHNRTGLFLVEVFENSKVMMEFYVRTLEDGERFSSAVWRLRQEYRDK